MDPSGGDGTPPVGNVDGGAAGNDAFSGTANLVFVTSETIVPGELGSVEAADQLCTQLAAQASLPGSYVAWLSTPTSNVIDRLGSARGWVRTDGLPVLDSISDIDIRGMFHPIVLDESGTVRMGEVVATATNTQGVATGNRCSDFTDASVEAYIDVGRNDTVGSGFTTGYISVSTCDSTLRLYCFGTDIDGSVSINPAPGRIAFASLSAFIPEGGLPAADNLCNQEASAAGLPGSYRALLGTTAATAASRFDLSGAPWVRPDGVRIAPTAMAALSEDLTAPIALGPDGSYQGVSVWTGSGTPGSSAVDAATATCSDWMVSTPASDGGTGATWSVYLPSYYSTRESPCSLSSNHLLCLQQ